ncbi:MAG: alpha/beta hydrolase [Bacteroidota bacterium]
MKDPIRKFSITNPNDQNQIPSVYYRANHMHKNSKNFVFFHGLTTDKNEYLDFYKNLALKLSALGNNILCFDARTHGESNASTDEFTVTNLISDGIEAIKWLMQEEKIDKVTLFGTSFGAIPSICITNLLPNLIDQIFLLAPVLDFEKNYLAPIIPQRAERYSSLKKVTLIDGKQFEITNKIAFTRNMIIEFALINLPEILSQLSAEICIMHGTADTVIPYSINNEICNSLNIKLHTFENMDHGFMELDDDEGTSEESLENIKRIINILIN